MSSQERIHQPQFNDEHMADGSVAQSPYAGEHSNTAVLRLPIQPPNEAHVTQQQPTPMPSRATFSTAAPPEQTVNPKHSTPNMKQTPTRQGGEVNRMSSWPIMEHEDDMDMRRPPRRRTYEPNYYQDYHNSYAGQMDDDWYEEDDRPRPYRRRAPRYGSRPPISHQNFLSRDRYHTRLSSESTRSMMQYEPDTPPKPRTHYYYGDEEEDPRHGRPYPTPVAGGGGRQPPQQPPSKEEVLRLPWLMWMNSNAKNHFVAFIGEFVGTTMFLFFAFSGTQVANVGSTAASSSSSSNTTTNASTGFSPQVLQYIALVFAFSLMVNVWIFFRISGGLFNPAVTFAMLLSKAMSPVRFLLLLVAQLAGSIFSSFLVKVMFPTPLNVRTTLSADTSLARGVFIEAVLTAELVFTIFMLAKEKHKATFIAPVGIGLALFIGELVGVYYTGGSLNPARSFGPCVVTGIFDPEHWIYWIGPAIGAVLAVVFYKFIKVLEYEVANPNQDADIKDLKEQGLV